MCQNVLAEGKSSTNLQPLETFRDELSSMLACVQTSPISLLDAEMFAQG